MSFKTYDLLAEGQTLQNRVSSLFPRAAILPSHLFTEVRHVLFVSNDCLESFSQL